MANLSEAHAADAETGSGVVRDAFDMRREGGASRGTLQPAGANVKSLVQRLFPLYTIQRFALDLVRYDLVRRPASIPDRVNATNMFLYRQFSKTTMRCNVCGSAGAPWYDFPNVRRMREERLNLVRETLQCRDCRTSMRQRIMAHGLMKFCKSRFGIEAGNIADLAGRISGISVLDTDDVSVISTMLRVNRNYVVSTYASNLPKGDLGNGLHNVDLQDIPFPSERFDIVLTSEVMEHVRDFERANAEIFRCLKPGGAHIFTVPFDENALVTKTLIDTSSPTDVHLQRPQIHGDPKSGGIAAYRICGLSMIDQLRSIGFEVDMVRISDSRCGIFDGLYFEARKPG